MTTTLEGRSGINLEVTMCELPPKRAAVVRISGPVAELPTLMGSAFDRTARAITSAGASFAGHPFARYIGFGGTIEADVGFPFTGEVPATDEIAIVTLPGGRAVMARHIGPYDEIALAWEQATTWMKERNLTPTGPAWECYLTGPEDPGPPVTETFWPLG